MRYVNTIVMRLLARLLKVRRTTRVSTTRRTTKRKKIRDLSNIKRLMSVTLPSNNTINRYNVIRSKVSVVINVKHRGSMIKVPIRRLLVKSLNPMNILGANNDIRATNILSRVILMRNKTNNLRRETITNRMSNKNLNVTSNLIRTRRIILGHKLRLLATNGNINNLDRRISNTMRLILVLQLSNRRNRTRLLRLKSKVLRLNKRSSGIKNRHNATLGIGLLNNTSTKRTLRLKNKRTMSHTLINLNLSASRLILRTRNGRRTNKSMMTTNRHLKLNLSNSLTTRLINSNRQMNSNNLNNDKFGNDLLKTNNSLKYDNNKNNNLTTCNDNTTTNNRHRNNNRRRNDRFNRFRKSFSLVRWGMSLCFWGGGNVVPSFVMRWGCLSAGDIVFSPGARGARVSP